MRTLGAILLLSIPTVMFAGDIGGYVETTLVTNTTDPNLINPWGVAFSATSPFWVSDTGSGVTTVYTGSTKGTPALTVNMPAGSSGVTGQVFSGSTSFNGDSFIFATLQGTITGWRSALGGTAETLFTLPTGASYTGLAISSDKSTLYAADFGTGTIDVFNSTGKIGSVSNSSVPAGYVPYNIQNINGQLYVEYALKGSNGREVNAPGNGYVAIFNPTTNTFSSVISQGVLNSPWGIAIAPTVGFGALSGDLLVGNFGDGLINAFNPTTGAFIGTLADVNSNAIENSGLWALTFGNGGNGGSTTTLYITAGTNNQQGGLFAAIATPEPATALLAVVGIVLLSLRRRWALRG